ncbi:MAG: hypothetical protein ACFFDW_03975 [Candidatus Thorarchaeota archaeon]
MSFIIERSHVIFKHLIHIGPEINVETVAEMAQRSDYITEIRHVNTPKGPLKEYLFRSKLNPQSLIVYSTKGFVIDAQPVNNVLPLFRDAYDFYEKALGDIAMTATVVMEINVQSEVYSPILVNEFINKMYTQHATSLKWDNKELRPNGFILAAGSGKFPEESIQFNVQPFPRDTEKRLIVITLYRSTELDEALKFIEMLNSRIIETLESVRKL